MAADPGVNATTLQEALAHSDPAVRIVAARLVGVLKMTPLEGALAKALDAERNARVSGEQVRSLLLLDDGTAMAAVERYLPHASVPGTMAYAWWLVRMHPDRLPAAVPALTTVLDHQAYRLVPVLHAAASAAPAAARQMFVSYFDAIADPNVQNVMSDHAAWPYDATLLRAALTSSRAAIREAAVWRIIAWLADGRQVGEDVLQDARREASVDASRAETWEQFGRDIIARETRGAMTPDRSAWLKTAARAHQDDARLLGPLTSVTAPERDALHAALGSTFRTSPPVPRHPMPTYDPPAQTPMRTVPVLWPGLLTSVFDAAGCQTTRQPHYESMTVTYRPDGRLNSVAIGRDTRPTPCTTAAMALVRLLVAAPEGLVVPDLTQHVLVPTEKAIVACVDQPDVDVPAPGDVTVPQGTASPKLDRMVRPNYPEAQRRAGIEAEPWMTARVTRTGCVRAVSITRTEGPAFDLNAIDAALHWRFKPFVVGGAAREVTVIIVLEFRLRK
jgi:TonB family protein